MIPTKNSLVFTALLTDMTFPLQENGFIKAIVMVLPNFTTAISVSQIDVYDEDGNAIYTSTTGWNDNGTRLISSLSIPVSYGYSLKITLNAASGGTHTAVVRTYINTQE